MGKLDGKVAVITAATSGMALATAQLFVEEGAYVFITGRRKENLDAAVKSIGRKVTGVQGDASKLADLDALYAKVKSEKGHIDVLFASAGGGDLTCRSAASRRRSSTRRSTLTCAARSSPCRSAAADARRRVDHPERLHCRRERFPWNERVQREQGGAAFLCAPGPTI